MLYVDVAYGALAAAAIVATFVAFQWSSSDALVVAALCAGGAFATKLSPGIAVVVVAMLAIAAVRLRWRWLLGLTLALVVVPSLPVLTRNWIEHREPVYPLAVVGPPAADGPPFSFSYMEDIVDKEQRHELFDDVTTPLLVYEYVVSPVSANLRLASGEQIARSLHSYDARLGGFGIGWLLWVGSGLICIVVWARRRGTRPPDDVAMRFVLATAAIAAATFLLTRSTWWPRYSIAPAALAAAGSGIVLSRLPRRQLWWATTVVAAVSLGSLVATEAGGGVASEDMRSRAGQGQPLGVNTAGYEPPSDAGAGLVVVVGASPMFAGGLWGPDPTQVEVVMLGVDAAAARCAGAYLLDDELLGPDDFAAELTRSGCGDYTVTERVEEWTGRALTWLTATP